MDYIESNLRKDEKIIVRAKISWLTLVGSAIGMIIGLVVALAVPGMLKPETDPTTLDGALVSGAAGAMAEYVGGFGWTIFGYSALCFLLRLAMNFTTHLAVTNKRVIGKVGFLAIATIDYPIEKIDNVSYNASLLGRILQYATVSIKSVGGDKKSTPRIKGISNAQEFKNKVNDAIETHAAEARAEQARAIAAAMGK